MFELIQVFCFVLDFTFHLRLRQVQGGNRIERVWTIMRLHNNEKIRFSARKWSSDCVGLSSNLQKLLAKKAKFLQLTSTDRTSVFSQIIFWYILAWYYPRLHKKWDEVDNFGCFRHLCCCNFRGEFTELINVTRFPFCFWFSTGRSSSKGAGASWTGMDQLEGKCND